MWNKIEIAVCPECGFHIENPNDTFCDACGYNEHKAKLIKMIFNYTDGNHILEVVENGFTRTRFHIHKLCDLTPDGVFLNRIRMPNQDKGSHYAGIFRRDGSVERTEYSVERNFEKLLAFEKLLKTTSILKVEKNNNCISVTFK